ncbi:glycosyltransferase family 4 protein [Microvirga subterranea]|uniref:Glycosyltransferase involved in cell wall biosynthesis n=1 Tax=Microvirga subterranea TaxID=186651 RepID=A0A370HK46_9HYPH|nr:glycosyltransferase family 4 protein [Microvirga subterranea]RDI58545.1 glycosyltransferase involved in cell wall biosynthesis [Microvirga subterranea]
MKIALCSSFVPFVHGGARNIVDWLHPLLQEAGHQVETIYLPEVDVPDLLFQQMAAFRWIDLTSADRIICFRPQAHHIPHPHKVLWFIHHIRAFYDLWDSPYRGFPDDAKHRGIRDALHAADTAALNEAKHVFTNSQAVSNRLKAFNNISSEVLYPPVIQPERFHCRGFNDEVVYICRLENHKRQHLLVDAMRFTRTPVRLRLCGTSAGQAYPRDLREQISTFGLADTVTLEDRWISEEEKIAYLADCLAAAYLPLDEDSYGYPSIEASHAGKPIVTTSDSGGVLELVHDGYNGYVAEPTPEAIAEALDRLYTDRTVTAVMGRNAHARLKELNISWTHVLDRLLA